MYAEVDETSECCYVCHDSYQLHSCFQVVDGADVLVEFKHLECLARVAARFLEFADDVVYRLNAEVVVDKLLRIYLAYKLFVADEVSYFYLEFLRHLLYDMIALRVYGAGV